MNIKQIVIATIVAIMSLGTFAQDVPTQNLPQQQEKTLRDRIQNRSEKIKEIKKDKELIDSLKNQLVDLCALDTILANQLNECINSKTELNYTIWPLPLISDDTSVFKIADLKGREIPKPLYDHYNIVCLISEIDTALSNIEGKINDTHEYAAKINQQDQKAIKGLIQDAISNDLQNVSKLTNQYEKSNKSSLSPAQVEYAKNLIDRYKEFIKYLE